MASSAENHFPPEKQVLPWCLAQKVVSRGWGAPTRPVREDDRVTFYQRPNIEPLVFLDADGLVIDYGNRWSGSPPENTYSVDTHPERFAPLHTIAEALIAHLRDTYDVEVDEGPDVAADLIYPHHHDVVRAVRVRPHDPACATLTFVFTSFPGVRLHAGLLHDFHFPVCGCDACDAVWSDDAESLEQQVEAVVSGCYREAITPGPDASVGFRSSFPDGSASGRSRAEDLPAERLTAAAPVLQNLPTGWAAWPRAHHDD